MKTKVFIVVLTLVLSALLSFTASAQPSTFQSPVPTLQLTAPFRPTPTGWPTAPFPTVTPKPAAKHAALIIMAPQPTLTAVPIQPAPVVKPIVKRFAWQYRTTQPWFWKLLGFD